MAKMPAVIIGLESFSELSVTKPFHEPHYNGYSHLKQGRLVRQLYKIVLRRQ